MFDIIVMCRNFGKELVILFHRTAAAPWGHVASIIKRRSTGDSLPLSLSLLVPLPTLLAQVLFVAAPWRHTYLVPFTIRDPRATNARAEFKGTGYTQLSSSRHFICKPTLPSQTLSNLLYNNLATPFQLCEPCELFFELLFTHSLFIPFGVKPCLLLLLLYINFVACISCSSSFVQKLSPKSLMLFEYGLFFHKM